MELKLKSKNNPFWKHGHGLNNKKLGKPTTNYKETLCSSCINSN